MTDQTPGSLGGHDGPGADGQPAPERLEVGDGRWVAPSKDPRPRRSRKGLLIGGGVATLALVGGGVWAWTAFFAQGPQPAEALPDSTLAYVSIDLDPPGQQKVEAIKTLRKFPAFRKEVGLDTDDDVRKEVFKSLQDEGLCEDVDYADDVEPWLGDRAAFALVDRGKKDQPAPVFVVQITDQDDAEAGLEKLTECAASSAGSSEDELGGYAFNGDWVVLAQTEAIAEDVVDAADDGTLAEDGDYTKWTEAAGDPGIVTMYAAPEAGDALLRVVEGEFMGVGSAEDSASSSTVTARAAYHATDEETETASPEPAESATADPDAEPSEVDVPSELPSEVPTELPSDFPSDFPSDLPTELDELDTPETDSPSEIPDSMRKSLEDFPGGAVIIRFDDGDVEMEVAMGSAYSNDAFDTDRGGDLVESLPDSTAVAYGLGFSEGWLGDVIDEYGPMIEESTGQSVDEAIAEIEKEIGLDVPTDIETLTGETVAAALDGDFDPADFEDTPQNLPAGFVVQGDPAEIEKVLEKIKAQLPAEDREKLLWRADGDRMLVGTSDAYLDELADGGDLGSTDAYEAVLPDSGKASSVFFVNFDAGGGDGWLADVVAESDSQEATDNVKPLEAFGMTAWVDGSETHALVKLTTED